MLLSRKDSPAADAITEPKAPAPASVFKPAPVATETGSAPRTAATPDTPANLDTSHSRKLIVGRGISLAGEITACDRLVVEGTVKVVLNKTRIIEITETGVFTDGKAEVEEAEISGIYEGELTVRGRLLIRARGKVDGTIRYGELEVERGGKLSGSLALLKGKD
jgi:cytoskeletal protein CcmA (bactofilin family)